jgi:hypothetical protein
MLDKTDVGRRYRDGRITVYFQIFCSLNLIGNGLIAISKKRSVFDRSFLILDTVLFLTIRQPRPENEVMAQRKY